MEQLVHSKSLADDGSNHDRSKAAEKITRTWRGV